MTVRSGLNRSLGPFLLTSYISGLSGFFPILFVLFSEEQLGKLTVVSKPIHFRADCMCAYIYGNIYDEKDLSMNINLVIY